MQRADWLAESPFTLMLSAGFFGFFAHTGVLRALEERSLRPARVIGCSAGSLSGGLWSSGMTATALAEELMALRRADFWDPGIPLGGLLRGRKFRDRIRLLLERTGVLQIEDCPTPFAPIVHDVFRNRPLALKRGALDEAIVASCTVPLMFRPVWSQGRLLVDGGVTDRCGVTALQGDSKVLLHFLPSRRKARLHAPTVAPTGLPGVELAVLETPELPKLGPFSLAEGPLAYARAYEHTKMWLELPYEVASV